MLDSAGRTFTVGDRACRIRPYRASDVAGLQRTADDIMVTRYMYAGFPHPYTPGDAQWWVQLVMRDDPLQHFVIEVDTAFAGAISVTPRDATDGAAGIIGYWLAPSYWSRGIATRAVGELCALAFAHGFERLQASVFEPNVGSARVLEGRLRQARRGRDGELMDELIFGRLKTDRDENVRPVLG
jgi:ribosomal-protein-alanine N-acetyltransferase